MLPEQTVLRPDPIRKFPQFFGGQLGIPEADSALGLREHPDAIIMYVDSGYANASDYNDGTDPLRPKATVQSALDSTLLTPYSEIRVSGSVSEDVITPDYDTGPNYIWIRGMGLSRYSPVWEGDDAATASLDLRAVGYRVSGFRFYGKTTAACVELRHTDSNANDIAIRTIIQDCYFDGLTTGRYGIWSHGCYDVWIVNCTFALFHNAVAGGAIPLYAAVTPLAIPYRNHIVGCRFYDSDNGAVFPCNGSYWYDNMFQPVGYAYSMTQVLNTSVGGNPGDDNVVWNNCFPGDYSIAGGYNPGAADAWLGNWADDTTEGEVGDNGITIARPT